VKRSYVLIALVALLCAVGIWSWMAEPWEGWYMQEQNEKKSSDLHIERFDRVLDEYVSLGNYSALHQLNTEYPLETKLLIENVLELGTVDEPDIEKRLRYFYLDSTVQILLEEVHRQFGDISKLEHDLNLQLDKLSKECPNYRRPRVYTQISCLKQSIVVSDTLIGISLDKYLGSDFPLYQEYYSEEQRQQMTHEAIVNDAIKAYGDYLNHNQKEYAKRQEESNSERLPDSR